MKLFVKNMKCVRCKLLVKNELEKLGFHDIEVKAGVVEIREYFSPENHRQFEGLLKELGLELTTDKNSILVEKIKTTLDKMADDPAEWPNIAFSAHISKQLGYNYKYLSQKFPLVTGVSIKKYFIRQRIEYVKQLLAHADLSLSQIAFQLHYSSVGHFSNQFKKETGMTPSRFRQQHKGEGKTTSGRENL